MYDHKISEELTKIRIAMSSLISLKAIEIEKDILFKRYDDGLLTTEEFNKDLTKLSQQLHAL